MEEIKEGDNESNGEKKNTSSSEKKKIIAIFNNFKPEFFIEYCFGIFRFQSIDGELRPPNWKMKAYGIFIFVVYTIVFGWLVFFPQDTDAFSGSSEQNELMTTMDIIPSFVVLCQYAALIMSTNFFGSMNIRMITLLAEVDKTLQLEICTDFYKKMSSRLGKFLIFITVSHVINFLMDIFTVTDRGWAVTVFPLYFLQRFEVFVFCAYVIVLNGRLTVINNYLKEFNQEQDKKNVTVFTVKDTKIKTEKSFNYIGRPSVRNMKIRDLATTYDNIGEICFMMNDVFNFQIFLTLVSAFVYIVITIWTSLSFYRATAYNANTLINNAIWCFNTICNVATMSFTCERLLISRNETRILVNKIIMNYDLPKTMRVQAKAFMELVEAWPLRIYVYDMFSIDIKLMLKFISVATTYLIVIIQISHFV